MRNWSLLLLIPILSKGWETKKLESVRQGKSEKLACCLPRCLWAEVVWEKSLRVRSRKAGHRGKKRNAMTPYKESQGLQKGTLIFMQCGDNFLAHAHSYVSLYVMYIIHTCHTILLQKRTLKVKYSSFQLINNFSARRYLVSALTLPGKGGSWEEGTTLPCHTSCWIIVLTCLPSVF